MFDFNEVPSNSEILGNDSLLDNLSMADILSDDFDVNILLNSGASREDFEEIGNDYLPF